MRFKQEFLDFMKSCYHKIGDVCPTNRWYAFLADKCYGDAVAKQHLQQLIDIGYLKGVERPIGDCLEVTEMGIENIYNDELPW